MTDAHDTDPAVTGDDEAPATAEGVDAATGEVAAATGEVGPDAAPAANEGPDAAALEAFDLDGDGKISLAEDFRAGLGMADAHAAQVAEEPGLKGKLGQAAHRLLDKLDND